jgi:hypothetical protein
MKVVQYFLPGRGKRVGLVQGDRVLDIASPEEGVSSSLDLVTQGKTAAGLVRRATWLARRLRRRPQGFSELQRAPSRRVPHLVIPIEPPEIWGTVEQGNVGADDAESTARPAFFFKSTAARSVGPNAPVIIRHDSRLTVAEPALAAVLGADGRAVAFTICADLTARDIALAHPGYLSQAKVYRGGFALGPCLVTADEFGDLPALQVRCSVVRNSTPIFTEAAAPAGLPRRLEMAAGWLGRDNPCLAGTTVFAGLPIEVPDALALRHGDRVDVEVQGIGCLSNVVREAGEPSRRDEG